MTNQIATVTSLPRNDKFCYEPCTAKRSNLIKNHEIATVVSLPHNCTCHYELCEAKRSNLIKRCAFTLAEVLITLGIIGVVAAITMPNLIKKYQQTVAINQLKKVYTELNQAIKYSEAEFGEIENWDFNSNMNSIDFFNKYFSRYIKVKHDEIGTKTTYYRLSGDIENNYRPINNKSYNITTNTGYKIMMSNSKVGNSLGFCIDINGDKKPNVFGKDVFVFFFRKSSKTILPFAWDDSNDNIITNRNILKKGNGTAYKCHCDKSGRGMWCAALIIQDGWKFEKDYPW